MAQKLKHMDCFSRTITSSVGPVLTNFIIYGNGTIFIWVSDARSPVFDDFHVASPDKFGSLPSVTSKLGEMESPGRNFSLRLSKRFEIPCLVSWSLSAEVQPDVVREIEGEISQVITQRKSSSSTVVSH